MNKVGTATIIRLTEEQRIALEALSVKSGHPLAALVRWCVTRSLPALQSNIDASLASASQSATRTQSQP